MVQYSLLFKILVRHTYYHDSICRDIKVIPSLDCKKIIQKNELLLREEVNGISVYYDENKMLPIWSSNKDSFGRINFSFECYSKNPNFMNFTNPDFFDNGKMVHFSNVTEGNKESNTLIKSASNQPDNVGYVSNKFIKPLFIISMFLKENSTIKSSRRKRANDMEYTVAISGIKTYWRYILFGKHNDGELCIKDRDNKVGFSRMDNLYISDEELAAVFKSKVEIPILSRSCYRFQLIRKKNGKETVVINRLPVASPGQIDKDENSIVSNICLNL